MTEGGGLEGIQNAADTYDIYNAVHSWAVGLMCDLGRCILTNSKLLLNYHINVFRHWYGNWTVRSVTASRPPWCRIQVSSVVLTLESTVYLT